MTFFAKVVTLDLVAVTVKLAWQAVDTAQVMVAGALVTDTMLIAAVLVTVALLLIVVGHA
jgi:hypothetical protein